MAGFLFFGAAGVGLPGTAGFVADDLMLHALWSSSAIGTVITILASATLAIATWGTCIKTFFGKPRVWNSLGQGPDLSLRDRLFSISIAASLLALGLFPRLLMDSANLLLGTQ
jgi:NADH:ubiquinone oxidoreductase subunit 4 (subunit M)